jgi:O-succinylbenzoate synthase
MREHVVIRLPLVVPFRGVTTRESVVFPGTCGWGEFAPFDDYSVPFAARWLESALESAFEGLPMSPHDVVRVNAIIPAVALAEIPARVRAAVERDGCTTIKVKVNGDAHDVERVRRVRETLDALGVDGYIRVDANGAWSVDRALTIIDAIRGWGIEYVEQPCAELDDCVRVRVRETSDVQVFVDESVRMATNSMRPDVDGVIGKVGPLGGVRRTLALAHEFGLPMTVSSGLDSSIGLAAGVVAASHFPDRAHGLATGVLFAEDIVSEPLVPHHGELRVRTVEPDSELLIRAAGRVSTERRRWWRGRLEQCFALLEDHERLGE